MDESKGFLESHCPNLSLECDEIASHMTQKAEMPHMVDYEIYRMGYEDGFSSGRNFEKQKIGVRLSAAFLIGWGIGFGLMLVSVL